LHASGANPFDLLRVGDQNLPAKLLQSVVNEAGAGHRLDNRAHRRAMPPDVAHETAQTVGVRRRGELLDQLAVLGEQADVKAFATEI
jgi:hypothetical protein